MEKKYIILRVWLQSSVDVASSLKAKVSSVLKEKSYVWKPLRSNFLLKLAQLGWLGQEKNLLRAILLKTKTPSKMLLGMEETPPV